MRESQNKKGIVNDPFLLDKVLLNQMGNGRVDGGFHQFMLFAFVGGVRAGGRAGTRPSAAERFVRHGADNRGHSPGVSLQL